MGESYNRKAKIKSGRERASPSEVYPDGKLHCHFTCGFDVRHNIRLLFLTVSSVSKRLIRHI